MKDQYFGDERDYFKYDLIIDLATCLQIPRFTNIVMLTPPDKSSDGKFIKYRPGIRNRDLYKFLQASARKKCRSVSCLGEFFSTSKKEIEYLPYRDDTYFEGRARDEYFNAIPPCWLETAVILVDPDIGLKPRSPSLRSNEHVLPSEIHKLKAAIGSASVLVMIQFRGHMHWCERFEYLKGKIGRFDAIYNSDIAFICLTNDHAILAKLQACLRKYATDHGLDTGSF